MDERSRAGARATNESAVRRGNESAPALRDAHAILNRVAEDEAAALAARERYRDREMEPLEPDAGIAKLLVPGEDVLAVRRSAMLDRREPPLGGERGPGSPGLAGDLYVTSARLVHVGRAVLEYNLDAISDAVVCGGRLLLIMGDGAGISLDVDRPRLLRGEIGIARASRTGRAYTARDAGPADEPG